MPYGDALSAPSLSVLRRREMPQDRWAMMLEMLPPASSRWTRFERACAHAVGGGITAAALIDRDANVVALAGTLAVVISEASLATDVRAEGLHMDTERIVRELFGDEHVPRGPGSGGSASGPAELPLLELGVTPGVKRN